MIARDSIRICPGHVMHARARPVKRRFTYPVFCLQVCMSRRERFERQGNWLFGVNRRRLVAFHDVDHGARDASVAPMQWLRNRLDAAGVDMPLGDVWLQAFPRVFGYVFNPVSFWFVHDASGALRVLVADVNNTFGERHQYVLMAPHGAAIQTHTELECKKVFHVSPFCEVRGVYRFRLQLAHGLCRVGINYHDVANLSPLLRTAVHCAVKPFSTSALLREFVRMPLLTVGVMVRIHLQALRLWVRRVPFIPKPRPPEAEVSHNVKVEHECQ